MTNAISEQFNLLNKRERILIAVTCAIMIVTLLFLFLIEPSIKKSANLTAQIEQKERAMIAKKVEIDVFFRALNVDPSESIRIEIAELEKTDKQITNILKQRSVNLMDPAQMGQVLETVLQNIPGITLQRLSSLPVEPLRISTEPEPTSIEKEISSLSAQHAPVYSHGFEVVLRGGYSDIYNYLRYLEGLSSSFFWDSLEYKVLGYPESEATLRVHTLSAVEGWIGG